MPKSEWEILVHTPIYRIVDSISMDFQFHPSLFCFLFTRYRIQNIQLSAPLSCMPVPQQQLVPGDGRLLS